MFNCQLSESHPNVSHLASQNLLLQLHLLWHHGPHQGSVRSVHHSYRLSLMEISFVLNTFTEVTWSHEKIGWLAVSSELLQLGYSVGLSHGVHQAVVPHLQLNLLESAGHGCARTRPFAIDVDDCQTTLKVSHLKQRTSGVTRTPEMVYINHNPTWRLHSSSQSCSVCKLEKFTLVFAFLAMTDLDNDQLNKK